jgi:hypothetical protein
VSFDQRVHERTIASLLPSMDPSKFIILTMATHISERDAFFVLDTIKMILEKFQLRARSHLDLVERTLAFAFLPKCFAKALFGRAC